MKLKNDGKSEIEERVCLVFFRDFSIAFLEFEADLIFGPEKNWLAQPYVCFCSVPTIALKISPVVLTLLSFEFFIFGSILSDSTLVNLLF